MDGILEKAPMSRVGIIVVRDRPEAGVAALELITWLRDRGLTPLYLEELERYGIPGGLSADELVRRAELMVVLGGDGTFLAAARMLKNRLTPMMGVNFGTLGFLTEVNLDQLYATVEKALAHELRIRERMMIDGVYRNPAGEEKSYTALNDFVISKARDARMIELRISINEVLMTRVRGDGLIISTPTGSTAYNLAAGGPILHPALDCFVLTPICPHSLTFRPVVAPAEREIHVELESAERDVLITADGQGVVHFEAGGVFTIRRSASRLMKVISPYRRYFSVLRDKLHWGDE